MGERDVLSLKLLDVAHHFRFGAVDVKHLLLEHRGCAGKFFIESGCLERDAGHGHRRAPQRSGEDTDYVGYFPRGGKLIEGDGDRPAFAVVEIVSLRQGLFAQTFLGCSLRQLHVEGVKEVCSRDGASEAFEHLSSFCRGAVRVHGDAA